MDFKSATMQFIIRAVNGSNRTSAKGPNAVGNTSGDIKHFQDLLDYSSIRNAFSVIFCLDIRYGTKFYIIRFYDINRHKDDFFLQENRSFKLV